MAELQKEGEQTPDKSGDGGDQEFEPTADMLVHDFDDEQTLAEEEALAIEGGEDPQNELNNLKEESDMPIEQLMALYGYGDRERGGVVIEKASTGGEGEGAEEEEMEEDDEEEDDDTMSSSSSSLALATDGQPVAPTSSESALLPVSNSEEPAAVAPPKSAEKKPRSELHLLYSNDVPEARLLRSAAGIAGATASDEEGEEEEDGDYLPGEDEWRKTIMIGSEYQVSVPSGLSPYENIQTVPYENEDKLLWTPWTLSDSATEDYLQRCAQHQQELLHNRITALATSKPLNKPLELMQDILQPQEAIQLLSSLPKGAHTRDDEQALHQLLQCDYNVDEAMRRRKMSNVTPCDTASLWSDEECRNFEAGLRIYGKDFHIIQQQKVRTRSVGELVQFYYLWKKTERHDVLANRARLEKKKYALHPGTTDYMDRFLDEQEMQGVVNNATAGLTHITRERSNSRSSSPNVHSLIYGDPKRLRSTATPPCVGGDDASGVNNGAASDDRMLPADNATEETNGQVLSAAAAAAAAAATVLPPPSESSPAVAVRDLVS